MSEDKLPPKNQRRGRPEPESLELDEELSPDEFLAQFADDDTMLSDEELSEEEFFAAFDRQNSGEEPMFVGDDDVQNLRSKPVTTKPSAQAPKWSAPATPRVPEEEVDDFPDDATNDGFEDGREGELGFEDQFDDESEGYEDDSYDGHRDFDPGDFEPEEDVFHPEDDDEAGDNLVDGDFNETSFDSEEVSYDLEEKLRLPRRPRRRGRFIEAVASLIALPIVFGIAAGMGIYLYAPDKVRPYIPEEYHAYLPDLRIQQAEPTLPPGVLDAVMSEPTPEVSPIPEEPTPIPVFTRQPIEVVEVPKNLKAEGVEEIERPDRAEPTATPVALPTNTPPLAAEPTPRSTPVPTVVAEPAKPQKNVSEVMKPASTPSQAQRPGNWYVQVSAEPTAAAAEKLKSLIVADGLQGDVYQITIRGRNYYRVVVGPHSKEQAETVMQTLRGKSYIGNTPFLREGK